MVAHSVYCYEESVYCLSIRSWRAYRICSDPENVNFFFLSLGDVFFPQVSEEKVMITIREIARDFPDLGSVVTSP